MPSAAWISIVVALFIFVVGHIITTVWWASRINTLLDIVQTDLHDVITELKTMKAVFVSKEEISRELALDEKEKCAIWKNIDELKEKVFI